jgi:2-phospho-L-lactate guanylyltransferase
MRVVVPFDAVESKTRLAAVLDAEERRAFAEAMLRDVLDALEHLDAPAIGDPTVLATAEVDVDAPVTVDDRPLTAAVNAVLADADDGADAHADDGADAHADDGADADAEGEGDDDGGAGSEGRAGATESTAVVMADLALATPDALARLFEPDADVVLAPGLGGGTNAFVARNPSFRVDYHGASIRDHREAARDLDATVATVDSFRLAADVDEPADLAEVLLHGAGRSAAWLRDAGFELAVDGGRVGAARDGAVY